MCLALRNSSQVSSGPSTRMKRMNLPCTTEPGPSLAVTQATLKQTMEKQAVQAIQEVRWKMINISIDTMDLTYEHIKYYGGLNDYLTHLHIFEQPISRNDDLHWPCLVTVSGFTLRTSSRFWPLKPCRTFLARFWFSSVQWYSIITAELIWQISHLRSEPDFWMRDIAQSSACSKCLFLFVHRSV